ncbi:MAG: LPS export ABC transporter periplasmic protein LptC [Chitinophagaceae bacterium]|jgi:LPS export ABC transporter protein LptC|nr:LPS export ABC transporter periplasmic protein LptC [Chitinophagaceae bacterium]MCF8289684.1 LPS export ABC transporter periplasmic protein LptC [Chitinophagaceae bacterium]MCF8421967.1 LPS export ABC transporter periplasmic protein LptC [Chitinophagaceae bacterium]
MINTTHHKIFKIAVACLSSCFFMAACENDVDAVKALGAKVSGIDVGKDVAIYVSNDGKLGAKLTAPLMNRYLEDSSKMIEFPQSIHVDFYKDSNQIESQLSAKYAKYKETENMVYLKEDVVVFNTLGDTLWCKEMYWDQNTGKFYTEQDVVVKQHSPLAKIYGKGLEANQNLTDIRIFKPQANSYAIIQDSSSFNP